MVHANHHKLPSDNKQHEQKCCLFMLDKHFLKTIHKLMRAEDVVC